MEKQMEQMKRMKLRIVFASTIVLILCTLAYARQTRVATGTFAAAQPGLMEFSQPVDTMLCLTNHSSGTAFFKFYDSYDADSDTTVSRTTFDVALDTSETLVIGRDALHTSPIDGVGVYGGSTSSTQVRITGW